MLKVVELWDSSRLESRCVRGQASAPNHYLIPAYCFLIPGYRSCWHSCLSDFPFGWEALKAGNSWTRALEDANIKSVHKYLLSIYYMPSIVLGTWRCSCEPDKNTCHCGVASRRCGPDGAGAKEQGCCVGAVNVVRVVQH